MSRVFLHATGAVDQLRAGFTADCLHVSLGRVSWFSAGGLSLKCQGKDVRVTDQGSTLLVDFPNNIAARSWAEKIAALIGVLLD